MVSNSLAEGLPNNPQQSLNLNSSQAHETSLRGVLLALERSVETLSEVLNKSNISGVLNTYQSFEILEKSLSQALSELPNLLPHQQNLPNISVNGSNVENAGQDGASKNMVLDGINTFNQTLNSHDFITKKDQSSEFEESATNNVFRPFENNQETDVTL